MKQCSGMVFAYRTVGYGKRYLDDTTQQLDDHRSTLVEMLVQSFLLVKHGRWKISSSVTEVKKS